MHDELNKKMDFLEQMKEEYKTSLNKVCAPLSYVDLLRFCKLLNQTTERLSHQIMTKNDKTVRWLVKATFPAVHFDARNLNAPALSHPLLAKISRTVRTRVCLRDAS